MYQRKTASSYGQPSSYAGQSSYGSQQSQSRYGQPQQSYGGYTGGGGTNGGGYGGYGDGYGNSTSSSSSPMSVSAGSGDNMHSKSAAKRRNSRPSGSSPFQIIKSNPWVVCFIVATILSITTIYKSNRASSLQTQLKKLEEENSYIKESERALSRKVDSHQRGAEKSNRRVTEALNENKELKSQISKLEIEKKKLANMHKVETQQKSDKVMNREDALWERIDLLKEKIVRENIREVMERFGPGPHKVQFDVELPYNKQAPSIESFVIELAPINLMPHSVHLFLEQVYHHLWDGCHFMINAPHILQAGPHEKDHQVVTTGKLEAFEEAKLDIVSFQEYSSKYPHTKYTVGIAGRPGGPDIYINTVDNMENHGPGGQKHHDLHEEADPCFGKIVEGTDVIEKMRSFPVDKNTVYVDPLRIVKARIITGILIPPWREEKVEEKGGDLKVGAKNEQANAEKKNEQATV